MSGSQAACSLSSVERTRHDEITGLLERTYSDNERDRCRALAALCPCHVKLNNIAVWERVLELSDDPNVKIRRMVFHMMADGSPRELEPQIVKIMERFQHDEDDKLKKQSRRLMACYRRKGNLNIL